MKLLLHKFIELLISWNGNFYSREDRWKKPDEKKIFMSDFDFEIEIGGWIDYNLKSTITIKEQNFVNNIEDEWGDNYSR
jgi:hypothetical protein